MRITILFIFLCAFSSTLMNAQIDEFDLQDFEMPFFSNQQLSANFSLGGHYREGEISGSLDPIVNNYIAGSISSNYFFNRNAEHYQQNTSAYLNFAPSFSIYNGGKHNTMNGALAIRSTHRFFYTDKVFYEFGGNVNSRLYHQKSNNNGNETEFTSWRHSIQIPLKWGIGRVHNITDAWRSIRMLKEMEKQGALSTMPTFEQIKDLADLSTQRNFVTFFDARLKRIEDLKLLDQWFQEQGLITHSDITYFSVLQDQWQYGANAQRQKGNVLKFGITPFTNEIPIQFTTPSRTSFQDYIGVWADASFEWFKPIKQNLQFNLETGISTGPTWRSASPFNPYNYSIYNGFITVPSLRTSLSYYPTTRIGLETNLELHYLTDNEFVTHLDPEQFQFNWNNDAYIYFSPQMRLNLNLAFQNNTGLLDWNATNTIGRVGANQIDFTYRLSFLYYFF